jgi:hypothetical protein
MVFNENVRHQCKHNTGLLKSRLPQLIDGVLPDVIEVYLSILGNKLNLINQNDLYEIRKKDVNHHKHELINILVIIIF